ncbi:MAG: hypothetical protein LQ346_008865 [Caloplaca aetnensis]|nr:MAG: hypothetical protein LQ346_008865 [Caloplaca aetnensis]
MAANSCSPIDIGRPDDLLVVRFIKMFCTNGSFRILTLKLAITAFPLVVALWLLLNLIVRLALIVDDAFRLWRRLKAEETLNRLAIEEQERNKNEERQSQVSRARTSLRKKQLGCYEGRFDESEK